MYKIQVVANDDGNIINISKNNPEYGYIKLEQLVPDVKNSWLNFNRRVTLLKGKIEDLIRLQYTENTVLPGKIVIKESLKPFNKENPDADLKLAGYTGVVCRVDDEPIYRQTFYTTNINEEDVLIQHTNTDEIKEVLDAQKAISALKERKSSGYASLDKLGL